MSADSPEDDNISQNNLAELTALMRKQVQLTEEKVKAGNASADQKLLDLRAKITRIAALIIVSAALAELLVHRTTSQPPRPIQSFGQAFFALAIFGGLFIILVDFISSVLRRAIWGQVNVATAALPSDPVPPGTASSVSRAKFWAGVGIVVVIAGGFVVFGLQAQRLAAQQQQRRDCLQLSSLRFQEHPPPVPPPPPPLLPGQKFSPQLEASFKKLEEQRQKLTQQRRKWETAELPKIRERRAVLEKKLAGTQCSEVQ